MSGWRVFSPFDYRAHLVADGDAPLGVLVARCGHRMPAAPVDETFRGASCAACLLTLDPLLLLSPEQRATVLSEQPR